MLSVRIACAAVAVFCAAAQTASIYQQAAELIRGGHAETAIRLLEPRLEAAPQDLRALTLMGMAHSAVKKPEQACDYFRKALAVNPSYAPALRNLAFNEMALGRAAEARTNFERLLELTPADAAGRAGLGQALIELHQTEKAAEVLEGMPREADAAAHFSAGTLLASIKKYAAAAREFGLARDGYPDPYAAGFNLMLACVKSGQASEAVSAGEDLIARGYKQPELYNLLSQAYEAAGKTAQAYDALRTATSIDPSDAANYLDLIALCLTHNNYDLALEIADIAVGRLPGSERVHLQRGIVLAMKEKFENAKAEFETAVKLAPNASVPSVALGLMLLQMDRPAEAVAVLRGRVRAGGDYLSLWFLGEALNRAGAEPGSKEEAEAIDALTRSVKLNPEVPQSRVLLAKLLARGGKLDLAEKHLTRAIELDPSDVAATYQLAQVCQKRGETARAKELFAKVSKAKAEDREQFTRGGLQHIMRAK
jgi:tetratricopeptide (TPR) repeat protein